MKPIAPIYFFIITVSIVAAELYFNGTEVAVEDIRDDILVLLIHPAALKDMAWLLELIIKGLNAFSRSFVPNPKYKPTHAMDVRIYVNKNDKFIYVCDILVTDDLGILEQLFIVIKFRDLYDISPDIRCTFDAPEIKLSSFPPTFSFKNTL